MASSNRRPVRSSITGERLKPTPRSRPDRRPTIEQLEPRVLLNAGPTVDAFAPAPYSNLSVDALRVDLSGPVEGTDARNSGTYQLIELGPDKSPGTGDDWPIKLTPDYTEGAQTIRLEIDADSAVPLTHFVARDFFGDGSASNWTVTDQSVRSAGGQPSFWTNDQDFLDAIARGTLQVAQTAGDDFIGFTFAFQTDPVTGRPDQFYLVTWKQSASGAAEEGLKLLRVTDVGALDNTAAVELLADGETGVHVQVLDSQLGIGTGWQDDTEYTFEAHADPGGIIRVVIRRTADSQIIWDTTVTDGDPLGAGQVGFFNFGQASADYRMASDTLWEGAYRFTATSGDPGLRDLGGNALDGDNSGEAGGDFVQNIVIDKTAPRIANLTADTQHIWLDFVEQVGLDEATVTQLANYHLADSGGDDVLGNSNDVDQSSRLESVVYDAASRRATITLNPALGSEYYRLKITGGNVRDLAGNLLLDGQDSTNDFLAVGPSVSIDLQAASDHGISDADNLTNETHPAFDITVNRRGTIELDYENDGVIDDHLDVFEAGTFTLTRGPPGYTNGTQDVHVVFTTAGSAQAQSTLTIQIDIDGPQLTAEPDGDLVSAPYLQRRLFTNKPLNPASFAVSDIQGQNAVGVALAVAAVTQEDDHFVLTFPPQTTAGTYHFLVGPDIEDLAGNRLDQNADGIRGEAADVFDDMFLVTADILGPRVVHVPDTFLDQLTTIHVTLDEPLATDSITADQVTINTPTGPLPAADITVAPVVTQTLPGDIELVEAFDVTIPVQTAAGNYTLSIGTGGPTITDLSGNPIDQNADGVGGQADDAYALVIQLRTVTNVSGTISQDAIWSGTIHVINDVTVAPGVTLTIEPDTVIKFNTGRYLDVNGQLRAEGTASTPIYFTSVQDDSVGGDLSGPGMGTPCRGDWQTLYLDSDDPGVTLAHVEVRYAGDSNGPNGAGGQTDAVRLGKANTTLTDVVVREVAQTGVYIVGDSPQLTRVTVDGANYDGFYAAIGASPVLNQLSVLRAGRASYGLAGGTMTGNRTWDFGGIPVHLESDVQIASGTSLTIVPGTVVKFATGRHLDVNGVLVAQGTAAAPIIFTSWHDDTAGGDSNFNAAATLPRRGDWQTLYLDSHDPGVTLAHVEVRYAGDTNGPNGAGGQTDAVRLGKANTTLTDVIVRDIASTGVYLSGAAPNLTNVSIFRGGGAAFFAELAANPILKNLSASSMSGGDHYRLAGGTLSADRIWDFGGLPVHLNGDLTIAGESHIQVVAGTIIKIPTGHSITIQGHFDALGTASQPIVITSTQDDAAGGDSNSDGNDSVPLPGDWRGLFLNSSDVRFEYVDVRYGGDTNGPNGAGGQEPTVWVRQSASPTIANSQIRFGASTGLYLESGTPAVHQVHMEGNRGASVLLELAAAPVWSGITAQDNGFDGIQLRGGVFPQTDRLLYAGGSLPIHPLGSLTVAAGNRVTISPGTILKFRTGDSLDVQGQLQAIGTLTAPIRITSWHDDTAGGDSNSNGTATGPRRGDWRGLFLDSSDVVLDHVDIRYAGDTNGPNGAGGREPSLWIRNNSHPTLTNVRVLDGASTGIYVESGQPVMQQVRADRNAGDAYYLALAGAPNWIGIAAQDNGLNGVRIQGGTFPQAARVLDSGGILPLVPTDHLTVAAGHTLTIVPGSVIKWPTGRHADEHHVFRAGRLVHIHGRRCPGYRSAIPAGGIDPASPGCHLPDHVRPATRCRRSLQRIDRPGHRVGVIALST